MSARLNSFRGDGFTWPSRGMRWKVCVYMWTGMSLGRSWVNSICRTISISWDFRPKWSHRKARVAMSAVCSSTS